jgi:hypothetical protein
VLTLTKVRGIMNKILLTTTVLATVLTGVAMADSPTVTIGGLVDFEAGSRQQKKAFKQNLSYEDVGVTENNKAVGFLSSARLYAKVMAQADSGLTYGAIVGITPTANYRKPSAPKDVGKTYIFAESEFGKLEFGSNSNAMRAMNVGASSVARGDGGIEGRWFYFVNTNTSVASTQATTPGVYDVNSQDSNVFLLLPESLADYQNFLSGQNEDPVAISYYTPVYYGFQAGASYTPDSAVTGSALGGSVEPLNYDKGYTPIFRAIKNMGSFGLTYANQFDKVSLNASAATQIGKSPSQTNTSKSINYSSWALGLNLGYEGFNLAGSYGTTSKRFAAIGSGEVAATSTFAVTPSYNIKTTKYWTAGVSYAQGPLGVSATYMNSSLLKNKFSNLVFGADYQLAAGMMPYAEVALFSLKPSAPTSTTLKNSSNYGKTKNTGTVFMLGTKVQF